ncbi:MAG: hypothetical protein Q8P01_01800 [bacterium]|nr:hypothetical protein [bacterium]
MEEHLPQKSVVLKISRLFLVTILAFSWIFSGWPQIFGFPPETQVAFATDSTPTIAGTGANATGIGTVAWTTPEEITVTGGGDDSVYAEAALEKSAISNYLKGTNFGFSIADGSTILGIKVEVDRKEGNTAAAGGVIDNTVQLIDESGTIRTTVNKADTATFWPTADGTVVYGGTADLWGEAAGFWTTAKINDLDFGVAFVSENKKVSGGGAAESAHVDFIRITVTYGPPSITVGTIGTQTASMNIPSTGQYVGGAFTMVRSGGTANVTSITITENGTVDALNNLDNIKLQYDLDITSPYDCAGESYAAGDTQYGSTDIDGFSAANGTSAFTGSVAVSNTQAMCVYVVLDVGSGASDGNTLEIEISNPSTQVIVSAGDVTPATAVAISGATTLNLLPNVFQDHYRWRNDNGPQADTSQTLYFNPTGNGFAMNFTIVGGCSAGSEWDCVDDGTADTSATAPTSDLETSQLKSVNGKSYYTLVNDALPAGVTVTQLDITASGVDDVGNPNTSLTLGYCITCDGATDVMGTAQAVTGADQTKTQQFASLNLSTTDMNNMQLVVQGSGVNAEISTLYVLVTYTVPAATWAQTEDAVHTGLAKSTNIRLRFQVDNTGGSASAYNYRLEWAAQSGTCDIAYSGESYAAVPDTATTEHFDMTLSGSSLYVDGDPTTAQLTNAEAYTFVAGDQVESTSNQSGAITLAQNQYTEVEYVFQANTNATDGGVYCFRVTNAGTALNSADVVAQVTLAGGGGGPTITFSLGANSVNFGTLSSGAVSTGSHTLTVGTNAADGVVVTYSGATLTSGANTITAMSTAAASSVGTEQFGINAKDNATPNVGLECSGTPTIATAATGYAAVDNFKFVSGDTIVSSSGSINDTTCTVSYIANITAATEAGSYTATLTYVATGNF